MKLSVAICLFLTGIIELHAVEQRYRIVPLEVPLNTNYSTTWGYTINDAGMIAGLVYRQPWALYPAGHSKGLFIHSDQYGFQEVGDYEGLFTQANRINSRGEVTVIASRGFTTNGVWTYVEKAVRFSSAAGFEELGSLGGTVTTALGIDSQGRIVGRGRTSNGVDHAFLYHPSSGMSDMGTFGGLSAAAIDINDHGWMSGNVRLTNSLYAFLYHPDHGLTVLGKGRGLRVNEQRTVLCDNSNMDPVIIKTNGQVVAVSGANGISPNPAGGDLNDWNVVVGTAVRSEGNYIVGYIWTEAEGIKDLNQLITTNSGWSIRDTLAVNNRGQITGAGYHNGREQAYRLDPVPPHLTIQLIGTSVVLSWTSPWPMATPLETSTNLSASAWSAIPTGTNNTAMLPATGSSRFFRLNLDALRGLCCAPE